MYTELKKDLTDEQNLLKDNIHAFARDVMRPAGRALDKMTPEETIGEGSPMWGVFRAAYEQEWHLRNFPPALGGAGLGAIESHIVNEEMGWGSAGLAIALAVCSFPFAFAASRKDPQIIEEVVQPFLADREGRYIGCWAITEPGHGSDTLMPGTKYHNDEKIFWGLTATADGDDWVINGQKSAWVSNGTIATHALTMLGVDKSRGMAGGGVALIPLNLPGVSKGPPLNKIGQRALNQGEIFFDNVRIPKAFMLVPPDAYTVAIEAVLAGANAYMGSVFTGVARAAFEEALAYARNRTQGGVPITEHQLVQKKLFDMFMKVETSRQLSRAAALFNVGNFPPNPTYSITSKVYCTTAAFEVASDAVQLHGGMGLTKEMFVEQLIRDARSSMIEDGSNDILSLTAAKRIIEGYVT
jgi:alkylation response protein AidB-like acyl-CoA dehydrogenase